MLAREAVIAGITAAPDGSAPPRRTGAAITLLASLDDAAERTLLREWLNRITGAT